MDWAHSIILAGAVVVFAVSGVSLLYQVKMLRQIRANNEQIRHLIAPLLERAREQLRQRNGEGGTGSEDTKQ